MLKGYHLVVGGFAPVGLGVYNGYDDVDEHRCRGPAEVLRTLGLGYLALDIRQLISCFLVFFLVFGEADEI